MPSSLSSFCVRLETDSGRFSEDCDASRAFCAEPMIRSRLKLAWRWVLTAVGDLIVRVPLVAGMAGVDMSIEKVALLGAGKGLAVLAIVVVVAVAEWGESPVDDGDMLPSECVSERVRQVGRSTWAGCSLSLSLSLSACVSVCLSVLSVCVREAPSTTQVRDGVRKARSVLFYCTTRNRGDRCPKPVSPAGESYLYGVSSDEGESIKLLIAPRSSCIVKRRVQYLARCVGPSRILFCLGGPGNPGLQRPCRISDGLPTVIVSARGNISCTVHRAHAATGVGRGGCSASTVVTLLWCAYNYILSILSRYFDYSLK